MAECPAACNLCTNAGLAATPAAFELDYVCRGKLQPFPAQLQEAAHTPDGCDFHCRDNMTVCVQEAARDACKASCRPSYTACRTLARQSNGQPHACRRARFGRHILR